MLTRPHLVSVCGRIFTRFIYVESKERDSLKPRLILFTQVCVGVVSLSSNSTLAREDNDDDDGDRDRDVNDDDNDDDNGVDDDSGEYVFAKLPSPCTMG